MPAHKQSAITGDISAENTEVCVFGRCTERASAICVFDAVENTTELIDYVVLPRKGVLAAVYMCAAHSDRFNPPKGWVHTDSRTLSSPRKKPASSAPARKKPAPAKSKSEPAPKPPQEEATPSLPLLERAFRNTRQLGLKN